jgi:hypothetical protein
MTGEEMSSDTRNRYVRAGVASSALCAAAFGTLLLFAPQEVSEALTPGRGDSPLIPLLGAALLGFGAMNWIARGSILGGIYGRAVVAGNQTHLTIGGLLLAKQGVGIGATNPAFWVLTGLYVFGAAFFGYLTFFSSGTREQ